MSDKLKYHRVVLRRAEKKGKCWVDIPGWRDIPVDFGWIFREQLNETLAKLQKEYSGHRMVRHFAIDESEAYNGLCHKLVIGESKG